MITTLNPNKEVKLKSETDVLNTLLMPVNNKISFDKVILSEENKDKYNTFLKEHSYRDNLAEYGLTSMNRMLLLGDSGTGKTFSTKALSNKIGYKLFYVDISKMLTEGNLLSNISALFSVANSIGHCILFFDEVDAIVQNRSTAANNSESAQLMHQATNAIFQQADQMNPNNIFIAASNLSAQLDDAFKRRFDMILTFEVKDIVNSAKKEAEISNYAKLDGGENGYYGVFHMLRKFLKKGFFLVNDLTPDTHNNIQNYIISQTLSIAAIENSVLATEKTAIIALSENAANNRNEREYGYNLDYKDYILHDSMASDIGLYTSEINKRLRTALGKNIRIIERPNNEWTLYQQLIAA
jgi:SpoVK/Ycf46/Vps4 family AAA+-type ATPase